MPATLIATFDVDPEQIERFKELFAKRHAQSLRLGAKDHRVMQITVGGESTGRFVGLIELDSMADVGAFLEAQASDEEASATIAEATGPGGPVLMRSFQIAEEVPTS